MLGNRLGLGFPSVDNGRLVEVQNLQNKRIQINPSSNSLIWVSMTWGLEDELLFKEALDKSPLF